jgi:hypothetical protein
MRENIYRSCLQLSLYRLIINNALPSQLKVTKQILLHWQSFWDLKLKFVGSHHHEQFRSRSYQCIVATVEESVLRTEMTGLESQEEDAQVYPRRVDFSVLIFCLSSHRHSYIGLPFTSRFIDS